MLPGTDPAVRSICFPFLKSGRVLFAENWEDKPAFHPYVFFDVADYLAAREKCVTQYEFIQGGISTFPYLGYYKALFRVRGAEGGIGFAECFDIEPWDKNESI